MLEMRSAEFIQYLIEHNHSFRDFLIRLACKNNSIKGTKLTLRDSHDKREELSDESSLINFPGLERCYDIEVTDFKGVVHRASLEVVALDDPFIFRVVVNALKMSDDETIVGLLFIGDDMYDGQVRDLCYSYSESGQLRAIMDGVEQKFPIAIHYSFIQLDYFYKRMIDTNPNNDLYHLAYLFKNCKKYRIKNYIENNIIETYYEYLVKNGGKV